MRLNTNNLRSQLSTDAGSFEKDEKARHIRTIRIFSDDSRLVQLRTEHALDVESAQLGHCIGDGNYDEALKVKGMKFYSLRDPFNRAHVTMEVDNGILVQCKGKENKPPIPKYMPLVQEFIRAQKLELDEDFTHTGMLQARDDNKDYPEGEYFTVNDLPQGFKWREELEFFLIPWIRQFPDDMNLSKKLSLDSCNNFERLGNRTKVRSLTVKHCNSFESLGDLFEASEAEIQNCDNFTKIPDGTKIENEIEVSNCPAFRRIGNNVTVNDDLLIANCPIDHIGDNLYVGGDLQIGNHTPIHIGKNLRVEGCIYCNLQVYYSVEDFLKSLSTHRSNSPGLKLRTIGGCEIK